MYVNALTHCHNIVFTLLAHANLEYTRAAPTAQNGPSGDRIPDGLTAHSSFHTITNDYPCRLQQSRHGRLLTHQSIAFLLGRGLH